MKKLTRGDGKIAGVCEGLGDYFQQDPVLFRLLFVVMFFTPIIPAVIPYLIFWLILKEK
tara:strand:+ start:3410 stop:3586 length:177 start_codon:yes stop_codon:yes gene_type:complete